MQGWSDRLCEVSTLGKPKELGIKKYETGVGTQWGGVVRLRRSNKNGYLENPTRKSKEKHENTENEVGEMSGIVERAR